MQHQSAPWCGRFTALALVAGAVTALAGVAGEAGVAGVAEEPELFDGWVLAAGDAHRHAGTAYSVVAYEHVERTGEKRACPHEYGAPRELYELARNNGYQWLSLSYHVGMGPIVKPDGTPMPRVKVLVFRDDGLVYERWVETPEGEMELNSVYPGTHMVTVADNDLGRAVRDAVVVGGHECGDLGTIRFQLPGTLTGSVRVAGTRSRFPDSRPISSSG